MAGVEVYSAKRQLLFEVGPYLFSVEAQYVREVLEPCAVTPVPGAATPVVGLINIRGTLMIAARLAALLGVTPGVDEETALVTFEHGQRRLALLVDRAVGVAPHPAGGLDVDGEFLAALGLESVVLGVGGGEFGTRPYYQLDVGVIFERVLGGESEHALGRGPIGGLRES